MALKTLMLRKKIDDKKREAEALRSIDFEAREAELEKSIEEATTDEEQAIVEEAIAKYEAEKLENEDAIAKLDGEIAELEAELSAEEAEQPAPAEAEERKDNKEMEIREMDMFQREDVKTFLGEVRSCIKEKRAISNVGLTIPEVMLPLIRTSVEDNSKLISKVNKVAVAGTGRQVIMGTIPEAVWTEMCANLNELSLGFNNVEVDGYKVGGFFAVCNAVLEDNDVNLANEIVKTLGEAIGKALDKAIVYGTGTKMPLGVVTRLAQTAEPSGYLPTARTWVDLHSSNVITGTGASGIALFKEIVTNTKVTNNDYANKTLTFLMNKKTHTDLLVNSMDKNLNAAIVAGISTEMPVVGGEIVELSFIPDGNIVFGYFDNYLLAERAGTQIGQSEHVRFINDQTVFKGTARYDGQPVIAEAFGVMSITTTAPATTATFPTDSANA